MKQNRRKSVSARFPSTFPSCRMKAATSSSKSTAPVFSAKAATGFLPILSICGRLMKTIKKLVSEGAAAHFTMFRMWGGGTYEPDCFYDYCSEYGILLMHDFMYACAFYPDQKDSFLYEAEREAEYQTKRLAHYPVWQSGPETTKSPSPTPTGSRECCSPNATGAIKIFNYIQPRAVQHNSPLIPTCLHPVLWRTFQYH